MKEWPQNAYDASAAAALVNRGFPEIEPVMSDIVSWLKGNGSVASVFCEFLAAMGDSAIPFVREALSGRHETQLFNLLTKVLPYWSEVTITKVAPELENILTRPSVLGANIYALSHLARAKVPTHAPVEEWEALFRSRLVEQLAVLDLVKAQG